MRLKNKLCLVLFFCTGLVFGGLPSKWEMVPLAPGLKYDKEYQEILEKQTKSIIHMRGAGEEYQGLTLLEQKRKWFYAASPAKEIKAYYDKKLGGKTSVCAGGARSTMDYQQLKIGSAGGNEMAFCSYPMGLKEWIHRWIVRSGEQEAVFFSVTVRDVSAFMKSEKKKGPVEVIVLEERFGIKKQDLEALEKELDTPLYPGVKLDMNNSGRLMLGEQEMLNYTFWSDDSMEAVQAFYERKLTRILFKIKGQGGAWIFNISSQDKVVLSSPDKTGKVKIEIIRVKER